MKLIEARSLDFDHGEFIPYIYTEAKRKKSLYGKIFQEFDRKGMANLKATIGYRSPLDLFDRIEFNMETPPIEYFRRRKFYQFGLDWSSPTENDAMLYLGAKIANSPLFQGID